MICIEAVKKPHSVEEYEWTNCGMQDAMRFGANRSNFLQLVITNTVPTWVKPMKNGEF